MKIGAPPQNTAFAFIPLFTYLQTRNEKQTYYRSFRAACNAHWETSEFGVTEL